MPLPTDPDTLRVPAFMRKRSLVRRKNKPLMLTALDRKQAGILPEGLTPKVKKVRAPRKKSVEPALNSALISQNSIFESPLLMEMLKKAQNTSAPVAPKRRTTRARKATPITQTFESPIIETEVISSESQVRNVAKITHYYDKIKVAVLLITDTLSVGDTISYKTEEGPYDQIVESMEINRTPVFKAMAGDEIGIKLIKKPVIDSFVTSGN